MCVWNRIYGSCCYRCQCGIYSIVATATAQQVTALKQRWSVFKLPSELIYWPTTTTTPHCNSHLMIISVFIKFSFICAGLKLIATYFNNSLACWCRMKNQSRWLCASLKRITCLFVYQSLLANMSGFQLQNKAVFLKQQKSVIESWKS